MDTKQKILTLSKQSEEMRIQSMRDKWFRMQEQLTDQAVTLVGQNQDAKDTLFSIKLLGELLSSRMK
jgi:hypothetical protein